MFADYKQVLKKLQILAPKTPFIGAPVSIEREMDDEEERAVREAERRRLEKERQILEAEKETKSLIPLKKDYEEHIFSHRYVDWDCSTIWQRMLLATDVGREQKHRATASYRKIPDSSTDVPATDEIHVPPLCDRHGSILTICTILNML